MKTKLIINDDSNTRGFTLVELLAVIVILAIVGLIAVQAVLPQMDDARRQAFAIEANGLVKAAQQYIAMGSLTGDVNMFSDDTICVTVAQLVDEGHSALDKTKYSGKVSITKQGNIFLYSVYLGNASFVVVNKGVNAGTNVNISETDVERRTDAFNAQAVCSTTTTPTTGGSTEGGS